MNKSLPVLVVVVGLCFGCDTSRRLSVDSGQQAPDASIDAPSPEVDAQVDAEPTDPYCTSTDDCSADEFCLLGGCHPGGGGKPRCKKRPDGCDDDYAPVCGCDGVTYSNECYAHAEGINVSSQGECSGKCGLLMHLPACPEGTFCELAGCGVSTGACVEIPMEGECAAIDGQPECGCDGKSYDNSCWRQAEGVALDHVGLCDDGGAVTVTTDKTSYDQGETVNITLTNGLTESIFYTGCSAIHLERLENGWVNKGPTKICAWEGVAGEVGGGTTGTFSESLQPGTWRILIAYGLGCTPGKPLSQAGCASMQEVRSAPFHVLPSDAYCKDIEDNYAAAVTEAKACDELVNTPQCTFLVEGSLACHCKTYVNTTTKLDALIAEWIYSTCATSIPLLPCPMCQNPVGAICDSNLCYDQDV